MFEGIYIAVLIVFLIWAIVEIEASHKKFMAGYPENYIRWRLKGYEMEVRKIDPDAAKKLTPPCPKCGKPDYGMDTEILGMCFPCYAQDHWPIEWEKIADEK